MKIMNVFNEFYKLINIKIYEIVIKDSNSKFNLK